MKIGNYIISDNWKLSTDLYPSKSIQSTNFFSNFEIRPLSNGLYFILFPIDLDLINIYQRMFNSKNWSFKSEAEAKDRVDLFLNKIYKLKAFL